MCMLSSVLGMYVCACVYIYMYVCFYVNMFVVFQVCVCAK